MQAEEREPVPLGCPLRRSRARKLSKCSAHLNVSNDFGSGAVEFSVLASGRALGSFVPISNSGRAPRLRQRDTASAKAHGASACNRVERGLAVMDASLVDAASAGFLLGLLSVATHTVVQAKQPPPPAARVRVRPQQPPAVLSEPLATAARGSTCSACGGAGRARCARCAGAGRLNGERAVLTRGVWPSWCKDCRGSGRTACTQCWGGGKQRGQLGFMGPP